jgi:hypothetical protein
MKVEGARTLQGEVVGGYEDDIVGIKERKTGVRELFQREGELLGKSKVGGGRGEERKIRRLHAVYNQRLLKNNTLNLLKEKYLRFRYTVCTYTYIYEYRVKRESLKHYW